MGRPMVNDPDFPHADNPCWRYGAPMDAEDWLALIEPRFSDIEAAIGYPIGDVLGCGHYGCVFESEDNQVVKFSVDPTEGYVWSRIIDIFNTKTERGAMRLRGITRPERVLQLSDMPLPFPVRGTLSCYLWCVIRERVDSNWQSYMPEADVPALERWLEHTYRVGQVEEALARVPPAFKNIGATLRVLMYHGLAPDDLHVNNVGYRVTGNVAERGPVILDPGLSEIEPVPVPRLNANSAAGRPVRHATMT